MTAPAKRQPPTAPQLAALAEVAEPATALLKPNQQPHEYVRVLADQQQHVDAIKVVAHALPSREAVWWAWVSVKRAYGDQPPPKIKSSLEATEKWIAQPTEDNRYAAKQKADDVGLGTPAGLAGLAAFFAGPTLGQPGQHVVPPPELGTAKAVCGAVLMSATVSEPEKAMEKFGALLKQGLEVAAKIKMWPA
jgi:hypothetical protein